MNCFKYKKLVSIDANAVLKCKTLNTLDISNNDISSLEPVLGISIALFM